MGNLGLGGPGFTVGRSLTEAISGIGDLVPQASLRWNFGVNNFMTYVTGNLTTGRYDLTRIANLGIGHNAFDAGGAYTYFDPKTGREFSATLGFTYNFENEHTSYQNGINMHLDWGASQFLTKHGRSEWSVIGTIKFPATAAQATASAVLKGAWSELDPRSVMPSQSAKSGRDTSTSKAMGNLPHRTGLTVGTRGSHSPFHRRRPVRHHHQPHAA